MGNLLFSPSGRIGPSAYMKGMIVLAVISGLAGATLFLGSIFMPLVMMLIMLILIFPFSMTGIKRSHDAGKSGWMVVTHILLWVGIYFALSILFEKLGFGPTPEQQEALQALQGSTDLVAMSEVGGPIIKAAALPTMIVHIMTTIVTAYLVNMFNKQDSGDNQYGPVPAA